MEQHEIRRLLGDSIYERAERYQKRVHDLRHARAKNGVLRLRARVTGSGAVSYTTQVWLDKRDDFISASCTCPYNMNGDGPCCKHIGAVLLAYEQEPEPLPAEPDAIPGVMRGEDFVRELAERGGSYAQGLSLLFGSKWSGRPAEPAPKRSDAGVWSLLDAYRIDPDASNGTQADEQLPPGSVTLMPELTLLSNQPPLLHLNVRSGSHAYAVRNVRSFLQAVENGETVRYSKALAFAHRLEVFDPTSQELIGLMRRQMSARSIAESDLRSYSVAAARQPGALRLTSDAFDALYTLYKPLGSIGIYMLDEGLPPLTICAEKQREGVLVSLRPSLGCIEGLDYDYFFSLPEEGLWRTARGEIRRLWPAINALRGEGLFFAPKELDTFCSYVLPELGKSVTFDDPDRVLLNRIPLEAVVQFYLDVPADGLACAHAEFVYGDDRVTPFAAAPQGVLRNRRAEAQAEQLLHRYLQPSEQGNPHVCYAYDEDTLFRFLDEGINALLAEGEVYQSDAFRRMQAAPPQIRVGVSVHGSVLDLDVDTGEFPLEELRELMQSVHRKKRYHRLRDGRLLKVDDSMEALDELNETLELSGVEPGQTHAQLPLYRAPSLDRALSGQSGVQFNRDDAFRRISRSFHAVKDSEYTLPESLQTVLRKYQRDGYRWLRTLDGYRMGGILADDMGLGKTLQVLAYLLARKEAAAAQPEQPYLPSLIVCPASLVFNWAEECKKFTPQLRCVAVDGTATRRAELAARWQGADLIVTSYDLLRRDEKLYEKQQFYACILDEAQAIKNHTTQKYKAVCRVHSQVRFALTGTPVENRLGELWSIFSFLMPGYLPPYKAFCARFEKPIALQSDANAARRLNQLTGPFILRRLKADVLKELPPKTESVYRIELEAEQRKLYLAAVVDAREKLRAAQPEDKMTVFSVLMRLRQICCDPRLVADGWAGGSAKLDACMDLVSSAVEAGHRILLFSQFTSMLGLIARRLDEEGISHFTLQGSTPKAERAELVRRFGAGEASVFLISLRAGGTGLNLTAADIVIHYDPWWNVAAQNQATDRAYRIGQQNPVQVYKLIAQDTIEEKILELQQTKQSLADTVICAADGSITSLRPEQLLALLEGDA